MQNVEPLTEQQVGEFLRGSEVIEFAGQSRAEVYAMVQESLGRSTSGRAKSSAGQSVHI